MSENTCLEKQPLSQEMLDKMDAYWRASNYLSAGQLYLLDRLRKKLLVTGELYQVRTLFTFIVIV